MNRKEILRKTSRLLSKVLRHQPSYIGIRLDEQGWTDTEVLLNALTKKGYGAISLDELKLIVEMNNKKRFIFNDDFTKIRANQEHNIEFDSKDRKEILKKTSRLLSKVLRHQPSYIGIRLDEQGWTETEVLLNALTKKGYGAISLDELKLIVDTNNKKRFIFNNDFTKIRANQGHSVEVNLEYEACTPPEFLYHGTATHVVNAILKEGIKKQKRHHVHLSTDISTASQVGKRHGELVILKVNSKKMHENGLPFYKSPNGVWLTDFVSNEYIEVLKATTN